MDHTRCYFSLPHYVPGKAGLVALVVLVLCLGNNCTDYQSAQSDIKIDLSELDWSIKEGQPVFLDENLVNLQNPAAIKKTQTPIIPARILNLPASNAIHHFTLGVKFKLDAKTRVALVNPAFVINGIGDNWAIYLNGQLLRNEIFIEQNQIQISRYLLHAVIPFPATLLQEDNELVIHLVGYAPAYFSFMDYFFGIRNTGGHLLGSAEKFQQEQFQFAKLVMYSVFLFFGLYHGLLFILRHKDVYNFYFCAFLICMAFYFMARSNFAATRVLDQRWLIGIIYTTQVIALSFFMAFLRSYFELSKKKSRFAIIAYIANCLIVLAMLILGYRYYRSLLMIWYVIALPQFVYIIVYITLATKRGVSDARWMLIAIAVSILLILWDIADTLYFQTNVRVLEYSILSLVLALVGILAGHFVGLNKKAEKLNMELLKQKNSFYRFVPTRFLGLLKKETITDVSLGDSMQSEMTVLFSDIRNFTQISNSMSPENIFRFINAYLVRMEPSFQRFNGFVDKFIGDGIMALFPGVPDDALRAACEMQDALTEYNRERILEKQLPIQIGIGINSGQIMLGTVGGTSRMDTTVIGSPVNLAARVEEITKRYHLPIMLTEFTVRQLQKPEDFFLRVVDRVRIRGIQKPVLLYECFNSDTPELRDRKEATSNLILQGMRDLTDGRYDDARESFYAIQRILPEDPVAVLFLERCEKASTKALLDIEQRKLQKKRVLIVDDNPAIIDLIRHYLQNNNYNISIAATGTVAIEEFNNRQPDIILIDYMLPDFDGITLIGKINKIQKGLTKKSRLFLFTAEDTPETRQRASEVGVDGFIAKPVKKQTLLDAIEEIKIDSNV